MIRKYNEENDLESSEYLRDSEIKWNEPWVS